MASGLPLCEEEVLLSAWTQRWPSPVHSQRSTPSHVFKTLQGGPSPSPPVAGGREGTGSRIPIAFRVLDMPSTLCYRERMENEDQPKLGQYLRAMREAKALSLRQVEGKSGISNAFISQMESGKVKQPSPVKLYKLAELYGVPYDSLMELAGYPSPSLVTTEARSVSAVFRRFGEITPAEETELLDYLSFLRSRARKGRRGA